SKLSFNLLMKTETKLKISTLFIVILLLGSPFFLQAQNNYVESLAGPDFTLPMQFISGGSFKMGSPKTELGHFGDESPQHIVTVNDFWIGQFEITWDLYNLFVSRELDAQQKIKSSDSEVQIDVDAVSGATTPYVEMSFGMGIDNFPAICMTQLAAVKFCEWLSAMTGHFYRLPTEAEWEYACRAGSESAYSFGEDIGQLSEFAWYAENSNDKYQKVGTKKPNAWGLYDMHGNVAEWTLDQYIPTAYGARTNGVNNPLEAGEKVYPKTVRGGSWMDKPNRLRSAARRPSSKQWKKRDPQIPKSKWWHTDAPFVGFRVVRPLITPTEEEQKKYWKYESTQ
ncbi:formylglycine-generating enzyme family protein, partial [Flavobacteriaceae bacterium]|nr:formylglycine-generating enzyme family protein [Flavobacteriaceae bacterium]